MGAENLNLSQEETDGSATVTIAGVSFRLRAANSLDIEDSVRWLNKRIADLSQEYPLMKPQELQCLLLLELALDRKDLVESGKVLLKKVDDLLNLTEEYS